MIYRKPYPSPLGELLLEADEEGLTKIRFEGQSDLKEENDGETTEQDSEDLRTAACWLDLYFAGKKPDFTPRLHLMGTAFQRSVWEILLAIPYGESTTYGQIAEQIAVRTGKKRMSAQAVGGAVGRNPIPVIVPCHRVIGKNGSLTGYADGLDRKKKLLSGEGIRWKE